MTVLPQFIALLALVSSSTSFYLPRSPFFSQIPGYFSNPFSFPLVNPALPYFRAPFPAPPPVPYVKPPPPVTYYSLKDDHFGGYSYETAAPDGGVSRVFYVTGPQTDILKHEAFQKFQKTFHHLSAKLPVRDRPIPVPSQPSKGFFYSVQEGGAPLPPGFPFASVLGKPVIFPNGVIGAIPDLLSTTTPASHSSSTEVSTSHSDTSDHASTTTEHMTTATESTDAPETTSDTPSTTTPAPSTEEVTQTSTEETTTSSTTEVVSTTESDASEEEDDSSSSSSSEEEE